MLRRIALSGLAILTLLVLSGVAMPLQDGPTASAQAVVASAPPTFYGEVQPILQARCADCHRPGEVAPFSLLTYEDARSQARRIKRMVQSRRMPPWSAEPGVGVALHNDRSLTEEEIATLVEWVDEGTPKGVGEPATETASFREGWQIQPDMVVEVPTFEIPADGTVEYTYYIVPEIFEEDRWVRVTELRPANREVTHHLIAYVRPPGSSYFRDYPVGEFFVPEPGGRSKPDEETSFQWRRMLGGYAPGSNPWESNFPDDQAVWLEAGSQLVFELHYTTMGEATTDAPRLGIDFFEGEPASRRLGGTVINTDFEIPPHAADYRVEAATRMLQDVELLSLNPHMHVRGKSWEFRAVFPDGREQVLVNVPRYDFMWQSTYFLAEPLHLPAGTVLEAVAHYDNSEGNRHNPNPNVAVGWGDQSWEEMMVGFFDVAVPPDTDPEAVFGRR